MSVTHWLQKSQKSYLQKLALNMCDKSMMAYKFPVRLGTENGMQSKIKYQE
jgi:hypothetical protein